MSKNILIVDDNEPTLKMLSAIVEKAEFDPVCFTNGQDALDFARENKVICALIDQYMEPMNGFTLARYLILEEIRIPMVMITANNNSDLLSEARKVGFVTTMAKPVDADYLLKLLARFDRA